MIPAYSEDEYLMLSGIQHFYFCKRQWALIHLEQQWAENQATMEGNFLHTKTDDPFLLESRRNVVISRAIPVSSARLGLSGILDTAEFIKDPEGIALSGKRGFWRINIVEYKKGKPKKDKRDIMQLTAQVMCIEEMLDCQIDSADLFYNVNKHRITISITSELRQEVTAMADEMHYYYRQMLTPKAENYKNCRQCSLVDLCMPRLTKKKSSVTNYMINNIKETEGSDA